MLGLAAPSSPDWLARALAHLDEVLIDHAHCEKKAASTALSLLFRYPEQAGLLVPLARLANGGFFGTQERPTNSCVPSTRKCVRAAGGSQSCVRCL